MLPYAGDTVLCISYGMILYGSILYTIIHYGMLYDTISISFTKRYDILYIIPYSTKYTITQYDLLSYVIHTVWCYFLLRCIILLYHIVVDGVVFYSVILYYATLSNMLLYCAIRYYAMLHYSMTLCYKMIVVCTRNYFVEYTVAPHLRMSHLILP